MEFTAGENRFLLRMDAPEKIQDFLDKLPVNWEPEGDTVLSPLRVLRERRAHCVEAAMFAAMVLRLHGEQPLLLDLTASTKDYDHVVALFRRNGLWGAIAKSNHYCLGWRDPVYKTVRELVMSYFHEYLNFRGEKCLVSFAGPLHLARFDRQQWMTCKKDVWCVPEELVRLPHRRIITKYQEGHLRKADAFARKVNNQEREKSPRWFRKKHGHLS